MPAYREPPSGGNPPSADDPIPYVSTLAAAYRNPQPFADRAEPISALAPMDAMRQAHRLDPDRCQPLRDTAPELWEEIAQLEARHSSIVFPSEPPPGWGDNEYWIVPAAVLSERVHFAELDLDAACRAPDADRFVTDADGFRHDKVITCAADYRQWLVTFVGLCGDFGEALKQRTAPYEFFGCY